jgi:membrane protein
MDLKKTWDLVKSAASSWIDDYAPSMGAALAYYTVFSIAPLLLIVISIAGLVFGEDAARGEIVSQLQGLMGADAAKAIEGLLESVNKPGKGIFATIAGIVVLLIGATTVFGELQDALDRIWRAPAREGSGLWNLLRARVLSFGMILGVGFLLIASLVVSAALSALGRWWAPLFGGWEVLLQVVNFAVSFALVTAIFAMIYKIMPRVKIEWHDVWIGAAVTSLLFTVGKFLIGLYIGKSGVASGFGAAASLVVLLVWVYYSAQVFLLGAEFTWVYAHTFGSLRGQPTAQKTAAVPTAAGATAGGGAPVAAPAPATAPAVSPAANRPLPAPVGGSMPRPAGAASVSTDAALAAARVPATATNAAIALASTVVAALPAAAPARPADLPQGSFARQTAAYLRRDPLKGVGIAVASGILLRFLLPLSARLAGRRVQRRFASR